MIETGLGRVIGRDVALSSPMHLHLALPPTLVVERVATRYGRDERARRRAPCLRPSGETVTESEPDRQADAVLRGSAGNCASRCASTRPGKLCARTKRGLIDRGSGTRYASVAGRWAAAPSDGRSSQPR